ncbi:outer membrane protein assembly factor BamE [Ruegeria pomeroyi]|uniref:Outer membrane protein assembly factor BamE n=1 Tax=Ruegeria pomeroyi TaxID=89184 RepID=A0A9Q3WJG1_9RHOB|nr:outer membrane protein assembly factor BamE [Ruegeria pomeroyi]MCE8509015.1 outer membrane protein assembly factor BamE [Ruegeria pomeroyi]MCE8536532.1 outer membrane protein assembly factor BamE [Ruegeria pomeroyi]
MSKTAGLLKPVFRIVAIGLTVGALTACTAIYRNHGYVPTAEELAAIQVGVDTRDSVVEAVGTPSSSGLLNESGYYYVATRMRHYGARAPQVVSRELVAISFDQRGVVRNIERYGLEDGRVIPLERRVTSSSVEDKTFIRQLLGNLGSFNPANVIN